MQDRLFAAIQTHTVDFVDIRIEDQLTSWVSFRGQDLDSIGSARTVGGIVRALYKGGWGYATFNDLENLEKRVAEACETARLVGKETTLLAPVTPVQEVLRANLAKDFRTVPLADKKALTERYNQLVLSHHPKIQTSFVRYGDSFKTVEYASSEGTYLLEEIPDLYILVNATAREGELVQNAHESTGGRSFELVESFDEQARQAAQRAVDLLSAPPVKGGKYTVVTDPVMTGVFTHEAFGHLSESDFVYENEPMQKLMQLGKRFGAPALNIVDSGATGDADGQYASLGTHKYDQEGVPMSKTYLVKEGILVGRLHSRETAAKMGEQPTGNARSVNFHHPPIVRMTNTYIEAGQDRFEDMIKDIKLGVLAMDMIGGQTAMEMFTFSAAYGYMIRDGKVAEMVRDVILSGNVFETLMNIDRIGDTVAFAPPGPGGCGKGGQHPLRVGLGGPYIRIQDCLVGGVQ
jgi:TldD protein